MRNECVKKTAVILMATFAGAFSGGVLVKRLWLAKFKNQAAQLLDAQQHRDLFYTWLLLEQRGIECEEYFSAHGYQRVAILGMDQAGRRLAEKLRERAVYGVEIDRLGAVHERMTVYRLGDDPLPEVDCMVICDLDRIPEKQLLVYREFNGSVVALTEVLSWLLKQHDIGQKDGAI